MKITLQNLNKSYGEQKVINGLNATFTSSAPTLLMGENGKGKTTLLRILMQLETADSGVIDAEGVESISAVFQENCLCEQVSAVKNLQIACPNGTDVSLLESHIEQVGITAEDMHKPVAMLSGGQKRRVAIARCVATSTSQTACAIFMDEPFTNIDAKSKPAIIEYVKKYTKNNLLIITTHSVSEANALGGNIVHIENLQG